MTTIPTNPERRPGRERNVGGPQRPTPPGKNIQSRRKSGRPRSGNATAPPLPPGLLVLPPYPKPDAQTLADIAGLSDAAHKATAACSYIINALSCAAPPSFIENKIGLRPGSLIGLLLADRELLLQYCVAESAAANFEDAEARRILAHLKVQPMTATQLRTGLNFVNSLRVSAEGRRRLSEALLRKATISAGRYGVEARARLAAAQPTSFSARLQDDVNRGRWHDLMTQAAALHPGQVARLQSLLPWAESQLALHKRCGVDTQLLESQIAEARTLIEVGDPTRRTPHTTEKPGEASMPHP